MASLHITVEYNCHFMCNKENEVDYSSLPKFALPVFSWSSTRVPDKCRHSSTVSYYTGLLHIYTTAVSFIT